MNKIFIKVFASIIITLGIVSCNEADPICPDSQVYDFKLLLFKVTDSTSTRIKISYTESDSIYTESNFPNLVNIPVDLNAQEMSFTIDFINDTMPEVNKSDEISFTYESQTYLTEQECGFVMKFEIDSMSYIVSPNHIDSAFRINHLIDADNEGNFAIFY